MPRNEKPANSAERNGKWPSRPRSGNSKRQSLLPACPSAGVVTLQLPPGKPDIEALRSVTREWLVPRLVEKFLSVHGVELKHVRNVVNRLQPSLLGTSRLVPAGPVSEEIGSQANKRTNIGRIGKGGRGKVTPRR
jgi:hypothetical protein